MSTVAEGTSATEVFLGFTHALRAAGLAIGPDRAQSFLTAVASLDAGERRDVYWAGRSTLCAGPDDFTIYDSAFERWFSAELPGQGPPPSVRRSVTQAELSNSDGEGEPGEELTVAILASAEESLRHRDVATLSPHERQQLERLFSNLEVRAPLRRSLRKRPHRRGDIDAGRTIRDQLRRAGEPGPLRYRRERQRSRRVVMLIDVSGSMEPYADSLLRLAHRVVATSPHTAEVFTLGTRLTRVTAAMRIRDAEQALRVAGNTVPDWSGGTRLGEVLRAFNGKSVV